MRIFPRPLQIEDTEGFTAEKDIFGRHELGTGLTNLVGSIADPMVIAIDGQWGSGKTTFLKMWAGQLRQEGFPVIYFDAFENDYVDDAFAALAAEIIGLVEAEKKSAEPKAKAFKAKAIGALKIIGRSALKVGVKVGTAGAVEATVFDDFADAMSSEVEELTDKHIGELLTKQAERQSTLQGFRDALRDLPSILAPVPEPAEGEKPAEPKPLIFIIDELDRCKPVFALALLERIKHFFAVPNVHFVLGTHMGQLRTSVNAAYGANINATTYLQKFISLTFPLTDHVRHRSDSTTAKYISHLRKSLDFSGDDRDLGDGAAHFLEVYAHLNQISLRDVEHIMTNVALAIAFTDSRTLRPYPLITGLSVLRVSQPGLYVQAKRGTLTYSDAVSAFRLDYSRGDDEDLTYSEFEVMWWDFCLNKEPNPEHLDRLGSRLRFDYSISDRFSVIPLLAHKVVDKLSTTKK